MLHRLLFISLSMLLSFNAFSVSPAKRVISLSPHTTELAYSAGLGPVMVGVSEYSNFPPQAQSVEKVANYNGIKVERIVTLKPDLILAWKGGNPEREIKKLEQLGFTIFYSSPQQFDDISAEVLTLSQWAKDPQIAIDAVAKFNAQVDALRQGNRNKPKVPFFYQLSEKPIITFSGEHWPEQIFSLCQGENIFHLSAASYPQVNEEQVIVRQPQVIFTSPHAHTNDKFWQRWAGKLPAWDQQQIWSLNADWINRPTLRAVKGVAQVCQYLSDARQNLMPQ